ncbi:hypothetical protein M8C21_013033, partial [Ambrosia artemisiifolia]
MTINKQYASNSKVSSWNFNISHGVRNCCLLDGVECRFGHVIGLDLSNSFLYGTISSNNSLFNLIHLRTLNLAFNDFSSSQIPSGIGRLSQLASLNLSCSGFSGEVPKQISQLRNLVSLDLSANPGRLKLQSSDFQNLVQNSSETLRELFLSQVDIDSELPASIGNLTHLNILGLRYCGFTGTLPASISNLTQVTYLDLSRLPSLESFSNLTYLSLFGNNFDRWKLPDWFGKLNKITYLGLNDVNLYGEIPSSFFNLTHIEELFLSFNQLKGQLSSALLNFQNLEEFDLSDNNVTVDFDLFFSLTKLKYLYLRGNNVKLSVIDSYTNETQPKFIALDLGSCNLKVIPEFLQFQNQLESLYLDDNKIEGLIPRWMWNISKETLEILSLSQNLLMGFEQHSPIASWVSLRELNLSYNMLHGSIPVPPPTTVFYSVSNNNLTGEIPPLICDVLDLSCNNITGLIPPCMQKLSNSSLQVLKLRSNTLQGTIPNIFTTKSKLVLIDLSENKLEGEVPRSLENCESLQILDLGYNFIHDTFPFWLGALSELQVLVLRFNKFHGIIRLPSKVKVNFLKLRIIDLSHNSFSGYLPYEYFQEWSAMKETTANATYMETTIKEYYKGGSTFYSYQFSFQITNKGHKMDYVKIPDAFFAVDLSSNMFRGKIPESIGTLSGLQLLNLSNNELSGVIPSSIGNLTHLEALDLSGNKLYGMIPQNLVQLNFLEFFNVSNNNLSGHTLQGNQFNTFSNDSYIGNQALCGFPLSMKCGDSEESKPPTVSFKEDTKSDFPNGIDWVVILIVLESALANKVSSLSHANECSILFQFKESMYIDKYASFDSHAYPKVASWNLHKSNCCSWDGVECKFGHVIGLDLSSSFLFGPISSNNNLFNLIHLRTLNLADNNFCSSQIPSGIGRLSQLANLNLSEVDIDSELPASIGNLKHLKILDLSYSAFKGTLPASISNLTQLRELHLNYNGMIGQIPSSFSNLTQLTLLDLSHNNVSGSIPSYIGNMTQLTLLDLSYNKFTGSLPSLESFSNLTYLSLSNNNFDRWKLPDWFGKLNKITYLNLENVNLYGEIPSSFFNLTQAESLYLSRNQLEGELPFSLRNLQHLEELYLDGNNMTVDFDIFLSLKKLKYLDLYRNNITLSVKDSHTNETQPQFIALWLASCNLKVFPQFLRFQQQLEYLFLNDNKIEGLMPRWMWNIGKETLSILSLSQNLLIGFEQHSPVAPWVRLETLDLSHNMLSGEIPPSICDLLYLHLLDLSFNNIIGSIPPCLKKISKSLQVLNLRNNTLQGTIPNLFAISSTLAMIDLSDNKLEGRLPRSLENCKSLQFLDLGHNFIEDTFPFWLGALPELQVLVLKFNKLHSVIRISTWSAMKGTKANATYMSMPQMWEEYWFSIQMTNKGVYMDYMKIIKTFYAIDLSSNMFRGNIPESITTLTGLQLLNLSNNELFGIIPPSMQNLMSLESLDLSSNNLSGMIPQDLVQLNFLEFLNVSNNNLTGPIPQGRQFDTFVNNSYIGNQALCGPPLSKKCGDPKASKPSFEEDTKSDFPNGIDWVVILIGLVTGLIIGVLLVTCTPVGVG